MSGLVEAECRKVCARGHAMSWVPWFRSASPLCLGRCVCGARNRLETRGPKPLFKRGVVMAGDTLALEAPELAEEAERLAAMVIRTYLNECEDFPALADPPEPKGAAPRDEAEPESSSPDGSGGVG